MSRRAGDLVQRLLAFSRRQALRPEIVDVGEKLGEMAELLRISSASASSSTCICCLACVRSWILPSSRARS